jgi:methionyl-tRNA synthetase
MRPFYVTTPIYYVNDRPHIGTAYSTIAADAFARYARIRGRRTRFLTGTDEHGQKIERRAKEQGKSPKEFVDAMAQPFRDAWKILGCSNDDFIRTTEPRHEALVQELWRRCEKSGDIYLGEYEGWYCVADEAFYTEKELVDGKSPTGRPVERVKEPSYFFRLSKYTDILLAYYEKHPDFVRPEGRFNEVKSFVKEGLRDLSVSRTTFSWGIPVAGDEKHVMYVWFDALTNYISALGGPNKAPLFDEFWEPNAEVIHFVGKDILRFHAVYWPAFLLSAGLPPPTQIFAHGWLTVDGEKMSKSAGNFIAPEPIAEAIGADVLRYYLLREIALGQDGDFSHKNLLSRYQSDLGNGLGNLLQRIGAIVQRSLDGIVEAPKTLGDPETRLLELTTTKLAEIAKWFDTSAPNRALDAVWEIVIATNKFVDVSAPWTLAKENNKPRLSEVCFVVFDVLAKLSIALSPVLPTKADELRTALGLAPIATTGADQWAPAAPARFDLSKTKLEPLFPRIDPDREKALLESWAPKKPVASGPPEIAIDDFAKIALRVGVVLSAEKVPKSDKLLKLAVDLGEAQPRQVLAGIAKAYAPEALVGKRIVVVANLAPRKMMGLVSHGMVLCASEGDKLVAVEVGGDLPPGSTVR